MKTFAIWFLTALFIHSTLCTAKTCTVIDTPPNFNGNKDTEGKNILMGTIEIKDEHASLINWGGYVGTFKQNLNVIQNDDGKIVIEYPLGNTTYYVMLYKIRGQKIDGRDKYGYDFALDYQDPNLNRKDYATCD